MKNIFLLILFLSIVSCDNNEDDFFEDVKIQTDAKKEDLVGTWAIFKVENNDIENNVPINFQECGRDFFNYYANNTYEEFIFTESSRCIPTQNKLNFSLNEGIITLSNNNNESETLKIKTLNKDVFVFVTNLDINGDNVREEFTFTAYKFLPPKETDIYSQSFQRREEEPFNHHIEFKWDKYVGYNKFSKYEILRSENCDINSAEIIETITDKDKNSFIDEEPPVTDNLCYFLRVYTNKGILSESEPRYVNLEFINPQNVDFISGQETNNTITLNWEKYSGYYFSHYEIRVQDQNDNSSPKIEHVINIFDINQTSFTDLNPPYVNNPIYTIYVHNKFENVSSLNPEKNMIQIDFIRPEILDFDYIKFLNFDAQEQSFFFYAKTTDNNYRLVKYDYLTNKITAESFKIPISETSVEMKLVNSDEGKELIFVQGHEFWVYNAIDMSFKYALKSNLSINTNSFQYLDNNIWVISDSNHIYTYKRDRENFTEINKELHFTDHQGSMNYEITLIDTNNILVSHNNEGRAIHYIVDNNGNITNKGIKEIPLLTTYNSDIAVNNLSSYLLNKKRNTIYSTVDFTKINTYSNPIVTSNFNQDGNKIFGTDNKKTVLNSYDDFKKELIIYDISTNTNQIKTTKGYSLFSFQDKQGNIISLSSGFQRDTYYDIHNSNKPDLFTEVIK